MAIFDPKSTSRLRQGGQGGFVSPPPRDDNTFLSNTLQDLGSAAGKFFIAKNRKAQVMRDSQYVASSVLSLQEYDFELKKELARIYRSDGTISELTPDYTGALPFGHQVTREDIFDPTTKKINPYVDIYSKKMADFVQGQKDKAPSQEALARATPKMGLAELQGKMVAHNYMEKWSLMSVANASNSVIRSFRERISKEKGFNQNTFSEHIVALSEVLSGAQGSADPGALQLTFRRAITDLVAAGVTEAGKDKDNDFALRVVAQSPLRNTEEVKKAILGLNDDDKKRFQLWRSRYISGRKTYSINSALPDKVEDHLDWALGQVTDKDIATIQARSIKSFQGQTAIAQHNLEARLQGLLMAASSPMAKGFGERESLNKSIMQGLQETDKIYPMNFFPRKNAQMKASLLASSEILKSRNVFSTVNSVMLKNPAYINSHVNVISSRIASQLGDGGKYMAMDVVNASRKTLSTLANLTLNQRKVDPFGSVIGSDDSLGLLATKVLTHPYKNQAEKSSDQDALWKRAYSKSIQLGVAPSFLTQMDRQQLVGFNSTGDKRGFYKSLTALRDSYGDKIYFDHIAPEIAALDGVSGPISLGAFIRENGVLSQLVVSSERKNKNLETLNKTADGKTFLADETTVFEQDGWKTIAQSIEGRLGKNVTSQRVLNSARDAIENLATDMYVRGVASAPFFSLQSHKENAMERATEMVLRGLNYKGQASIVKLDGKAILPPPQYNYGQPDTDLLEEVLRNRNFLAEVVMPQIEPNDSYKSRAQIENTPVGELYINDLQDKDTVWWDFSESGLRPMKYNEVFDASQYLLKKGTNSPILIPYQDLDQHTRNPNYSSPGWF